MAEPLICPCGCGLNSDAWDEPTREAVLAQIRTHGPTFTVTVNKRSWTVPKLYVAFHGIKARDVPALAERFGWAEA